MQTFYVKSYSSFYRSYYSLWNIHPYKLGFSCVYVFSESWTLLIKLTVICSTYFLGLASHARTQHWQVIYHSNTVVHVLIYNFIAIPNTINFLSMIRFLSVISINIVRLIPTFGKGWNWRCSLGGAADRLSW